MSEILVFTRPTSASIKILGIAYEPEAALLIAKRNTNYIDRICLTSFRLLSCPGIPETEKELFNQALNVYNTQLVC